MMKSNRQRRNKYAVTAWLWFPLFTFGINFYPLQFIEQNSRMICVLLTSLMIAFCIIAMMNTSEMVSRIRGREM